MSKILEELFIEVEKTPLDLKKIRDLLKSLPQKTINEKDKDGKTLLIRAITSIAIHYSKAQKELIELLLQQGADPTIEDQNNTTPIMWAARNGKREIIEQLLQHKSVKETLQKIDSEGNTVLHHACYTYNPEIIKIFASEELINKQNKVGRSPFFIVSTYVVESTLETLKNFLALGADPNLCDNDGTSPLINLAGGNNKEIVEFLLKQKGVKDNINKRNMNGETAIFKAASANIVTNLSIFEILLAAGANPNIPDYSGEILLKLAIRRKNNALVDFLSKTKELDEASRIATPILKIFNGYEGDWVREFSLEDATRLRDFLRNFFGKKIIDTIFQRYSLDLKSSPKNLQQLIVLANGLATNLDPETIQHIQTHFTDRTQLIVFLQRVFWNRQFFIPSLQLTSLKPGDKPEKFVDEARIRDAFEGDKLLNSCTQRIEACASMIKAAVCSSPENREPLKKSLHSAYISQILAAGAGVYEIPTNVPPHQIVPIPNKEGTIELYQLEKTLNQDGLLCNIFRVLIPKSSENSPDIVTTFRGTANKAGVKRDTDFRAFEPVPGRHLMKRHMMEILEGIGGCVLSLNKELGNNKPNKYKHEIGGFSLGASDAQNLLVHAVHIQAIRAIDSGKMDIKLLNSSKTARETLAKVRKRMEKHLKKTNKKESTELDKLSNLTTDLYVWGAPGIYSADNKSTCVILDKFNMGKDIDIQFSSIVGDRVTTYGTHLGSLGKHKKHAGTEKDFRPRMDSFQRVKVAWEAPAIRPMPPADIWGTIWDRFVSPMHTVDVWSLVTDKPVNLKVMRYRNVPDAPLMTAKGPAAAAKDTKTPAEKPLKQQGFFPSFDTHSVHTSTSAAASAAWKPASASEPAPKIVKSNVDEKKDKPNI